MLASRDVIRLINDDVAETFPGPLLPFVKAHLCPKRLTFDMTPSAVRHETTPQPFTSCLPPAEFSSARLSRAADVWASNYITGALAVIYSAGEHVELLESQVEAAGLVKSDLRSAPHSIALLSSPLEATHVSWSYSINPNAPLNSPFVDFKLSEGCVVFGFICHSLAVTACTSQPSSSPAQQRWR